MSPQICEPYCSARRHLRDSTLALAPRRAAPSPRESEYPSGCVRARGRYTEILSRKLSGETMRPRAGNRANGAPRRRQAAGIAKEARNNLMTRESFNFLMGPTFFAHINTNALPESSAGSFSFWPRLPFLRLFPFSALRNFKRKVFARALPRGRCKIYFDDAVPGDWKS